MNPQLLHSELDDGIHEAALLTFRAYAAEGSGHCLHNGAITNISSDATSRLLVCTTVAARGLDFPSLRHVIMYDMLSANEDVAAFIHCAGRTARRGQNGLVSCLVQSTGSVGKFRNLHALQDAPQIHFPSE
jgi:superfamily II DNA/RNA helicase